MKSVNVQGTITCSFLTPQISLLSLRGGEGIPALVVGARCVEIAQRCLGGIEGVVLLSHTS